MIWLQRLWHQRFKRPHRLAYGRFGDGPQFVLMLHGLAADGSFWQPLIRELPASQYTMIVPDLLGHGNSPKPEYSNYSTSDQAAAVEALLRRLGIGSVVVVGHSMGGLVATRLASQNPRLVSKLLLYEPPLFADMPEFRTHARRRKFYFDLFERIAANPSGTITVARVVARIAKSWTQYLQSEQTWLPIERSLRNSIMASSAVEELRDITIQTDIIHGQLDVVVPKADLKRMLRHNPHISFYKTIDRHRLSKSGARYLARLIAPSGQLSDTKKVKRGGIYARSME